MTGEEKLENRLQELKMAEETLYKSGIHAIAGVDEVGRGPLAGPVVASCVVLARDFCQLGIDDSKKLSSKKRETLALTIKKEALAYGFGIVEHSVIDEINILRATKKAMLEAIKKCDLMLSEKGACIDYLLIDGISLEGLEIRQEAVIKGDSSCLSIAAASILAKVERDNMMKAYHLLYPYYNFASNKGYGTKDHYRGLDEKGPCPIHRKSFIKEYIYYKKR